ncbi:hypothetical protein VTK73DRAFT_8667 [Phialemonium thermophilum]|uniref:Uncharacterized protein n=1 Tax=Phialemonium thermophilum TaxID=223376 RepID=A0ABR3XP62_9PEZI
MTSVHNTLKKVHHRRKPRLYVALFPTGITDNEELSSYDWSFLIGPKDENKPHVPGMQLRIRKVAQLWVLEELVVDDVRNTGSLAVRVLIAKIRDKSRLVQLIKDVHRVQDDDTWNTRSWIADVLNAMATTGGVVGRSVLNWPLVDARARQYVADKIAAGRYAGPQDPTAPRPTWDLIDDKEIAP